MIWLTPMLYVGINLVDAYTDKDKNVNHTRGAILYAAACLLIAIPLLNSGFATWYDVIIFPVITRAAFFDPVLNLLRGKSILYEGARKPKGKRSVIDELERRLGLSVFWLRVIYLTVYILYVVFIYT